MAKKIIVVLLSAAMLLAAALYLFFWQVRVQPFTSIKYLDGIPVQIRQMYGDESLQDKKLQLTAVVKISGKNIQYVHYGIEASFYARMLPLINGLKAAHSNLHTRLPDGVYLFSLADGEHYGVYPWPILALASSKALVNSGRVVLMPDVEALNGYSELFKQINIGVHKYPWAKKTAKIFWRGQSTGAAVYTNDFDDFPRGRFLNYVHDSSYVDAAFVAYSPYLNQDFAQRLKQKFPLQPGIPRSEFMAYKYLIDIDGQSCSYERMALAMYSNSLLLKHQTDKVQWYYDRLQPGQNFLPIAEDFSNLQAQYQWAEEHPKEVRAMINKSRNLAIEVFSQHGVRKATAAALRRYQKLVTTAQR